MTLVKNKVQVSFEFFPARTEEGGEKLIKTAQQLAGVSPEFFSVTYGAGGSTRDRTKGTVSQIIEATGIPTAPHLSCVGDTRESLRELLSNYKDQGINRIVALRGDLPSGMGRFASGHLQYANELVEFIREETGDHFHIEVAAYPEVHPQAHGMDADLANFKRKVESGATSAITQYFFNADSYFYFVDRCRKEGIDIPIVPGIMPITNYIKLARFSDACGAEMPRWIRKQLESYGDDSASIKAFGEEVITRLCERLIEGGVPALHFYSLNMAGPSLKLVQNLS
ncbi:methylenetetrahydrofolate reductase [NAD(P)H] [Spongorhabdus nitratireducens]